MQGYGSRTSPSCDLHVRTLPFDQPSEQAGRHASDARARSIFLEQKGRAWLLGEKENENENLNKELTLSIGG